MHHYDRPGEISGLEVRVLPGSPLHSSKRLLLISLDVGPPSPPMQSVTRFARALTICQIKTCAARANGHDMVGLG
jgi:hypothetical protein